MHRHRTALLPLVLVGLIGVLVPTERGAAAQDDPPPSETTTEWSDNTLVVTAAAPGTLELTDTPGAPYDGPRIHCAWFTLVIGGTTLDAVRIADPEVGATYVYNCWFVDPWDDRYPGYPLVAVYDPIVDPPGPLITTPVAARYALDSIEFERPSVVTSPAGIQIVGIPSWFAVDSELDYAPASAQAGPVWATVRPVFRDVTWDLGDGARLVCTDDATTRWDPTGPDDQHSRCIHTFTRAPSPSDPGPISATASWTIWQRTDRTAGSWVVWGTVSLTTSVDLPVIGLQAVID
ncbi:MAG: hypothetical protein R2707_14290 [Acidimicrobiales bacterium]